MASIHDVLPEYDVSGVIVGGEYAIGWLTYEGRKQGRQLYGDDYIDLKAKAEKMKSEILAECAPVAGAIYPLDSEWRLKIALE